MSVVLVERQIQLRRWGTVLVAVMVPLVGITMWQQSHRQKAALI
jgi:hypothetical protein